MFIPDLWEQKVTFAVNSFSLTLVFCSDSFPIFTSNETCSIKPPDVSFVVLNGPKLGHNLFCGARLTPFQVAISHTKREISDFATKNTPN